MLLADRLVQSHLLKQSIVQERADQLEVKLIGLMFTDLFTRISKQIEEGLENSRHLDYMQKLQIQEWFLPVL